MYYDGSYYDGENGVTVDVAAENITTKVVNNIVVTLSGSSRSFTGDFMDDHKVNDLTVTVADYEGQPIEDITVGNVKVSYTRGTVSLDTYGYTSDAPSPQITGTGSPENGSATEYRISEMNFQMAGAYKSAEVTLTINGVSGTAGKANGVALKYMVNGKANDTCPQFDVKWTAPNVTVTGVSPGTSEKLTIGASDYNYEDNVWNYFEDHLLTVYTYRSGSFIGKNLCRLSEATLKITNAGSRMTKAEIAYSWTSNGGTWKNSWTFNSDKSTDTSTIGAGDTELLGSYGSRRDITGTVSLATGEEIAYRFADGLTISTIKMTCDGKDYIVKLSEPLVIRQASATLPASLKYEANSDFSEFSVSGYTSIGGTGVPVTVTLPDSNQKITHTEIVNVDGGSTPVKTETQKFYVLESDNIDALEKDDAGKGKTQTRTQKLKEYTRTIQTDTVKATQETYEVTYQLDGWTIYTCTYKEGVGTWNSQGTFKKAGSTFTGNGVYKAVPHFKVVEKVLKSSSPQELQRITTTDVFTTTVSRSQTRSAKGWGVYWWGSWSNWNAYAAADIQEKSYVLLNPKIEWK